MKPTPSINVQHDVTMPKLLVAALRDSSSTAAVVGVVVAVVVVVGVIVVGVVDVGVVVVVVVVVNVIVVVVRQYGARFATSVLYSANATSGNGDSAGFCGHA